MQSPWTRWVLAGFLLAVLTIAARAGEADHVIAWLLAPVDPSRNHDIGPYAAWHGRLMVLAWAFLFPLGILAARYFKIMPGQNWPGSLDNQVWWHSHRISQYAGGIATLAALWLAWEIPSSGQPAASWHRWLGWCVAMLVLAQFAGGWLRGSKGGPTAPAPDGSFNGDHYNMTARRRMFEHAHKCGGYVVLLCGGGAILIGLHITNAPRWMWIAIVAWWSFYAACFVWLQIRGRAVDTYQAIWGPENRHPGNRIAPIGCGVRRPGSAKH